jgi:phenylpropionate dioxygenase-like ring-hydroxylating dioxygenase large terminal subunit
MPPESRFRDKVRVRAYPTREWGDLVWAYLGPAGHEPALPEIEFAVLPASHRLVSKKLQQCN